MNEPHPDHQYVEALLHNDPIKIDELYQKYSQQIIQFVLKNNGTKKDAQDLLQEGLIAIYQKARKGNFVLTCPFGAYLYLICRSKWLNELEKRKRDRVTIQESEGFKEKAESAELAQATLKQAERDRLFWQKFKELGESCQNILRLSWTGKSMQLVAEMLDISYQYARKKKSECIAKLIQLVKTAPEYDQLR